MRHLTDQEFDEIMDLNGDIRQRGCIQYIDDPESLWPDMYGFPNQSPDDPLQIITLKNGVTVHVRQRTGNTCNRSTPPIITTVWEIHEPSRVI